MTDFKKPDASAKLRNTMTLKDLELPEDIDVDVKGGSVNKKIDESAKNVIQSLRG